MITEKRVRELREQAADSQYVYDRMKLTRANVLDLCDLALRALEGEKREWSGYSIEEIHTYYVSDNGELCEYENHGLPGDELLCKYSDVRKLLTRSSPVDRAQGECKTCSGSGEVGPILFLRPCHVCDGTGRTPAAEVAREATAGRDIERLVSHQRQRIEEFESSPEGYKRMISPSAIERENEILKVLISLCNASQGSVRVPKEMASLFGRALYYINNAGTLGAKDLAADIRNALGEP